MTNWAEEWFVPVLGGALISEGIMSGHWLSVALGVGVSVANLFITSPRVEHE